MRKRARELRQRSHQSLLELWESRTHRGKLHQGNLNAADEDKGDSSDEACEDEDELHVCCLLEESENEQSQQVISKKSKLKLKNLAHVSLLSVENNSCASPRKVIEVKDNWANIRTTMDTGAAGHAMPAEMF